MRTTEKLSQQAYRRVVSIYRLFLDNGCMKSCLFGRVAPLWISGDNCLNGHVFIEQTSASRTSANKRQPIERQIEPSAIGSHRRIT